MEMNNNMEDSNDSYEESMVFWEEKVSSLTDNMVLPYDNKFKNKIKKKEYDFIIDSNLSNDIISMCNNEDFLIFIILLSAFNVQLYKYGNDNNITIGIPMYNVNSNVDESINEKLFFVNKINNDMRFKELLINIKKEVSDCYLHQYYPLDEIMNKLPNTIMELVPINFAMKNIHESSLISNIIDSESNKLTFIVELIDNKIVGKIVFNLEEFSENTVVRIKNHFITILRETLKNVEIDINSINIIEEEETTKLLNEFNNTCTEYLKYKTIHEIFEEQVKKTPDNIAVIFGHQKLTYTELNKKANQLARVLRGKGVKSNTIVGIMVERSMNMILGIFAILKAGAAYLPIDPNYPENRIKYILEDSETRILLTQKRFVELIEFTGEIIDLEDYEIYLGSDENLETISNPRSLAYVIYTSGSTGHPKGVLINNYSVINRLNWMQKKYPLGSEDVILQKTTYTFDVSVWELFWWSFIGAKVCLLEPRKEKEIETIIEAITKNRITTIHFVPSMFNVFVTHIFDINELEKIKTLKYIFTSGEALGMHQVNNFNTIINRNYPIDLVNLYGPTEATVDVTYYECLKSNYDSRIPIGKPIDNTRIYILSKNKQLQPIGIQGELCIAGDGLARGYLNREELTKEKFIENPYVKGEKIYKTGDLAKWCEDGNIEFLGRMDHQVKIRGFRIELGEIENQLINYKSIREAVIIDRQDKSGDKYLCAYVVSDKDLIVSELREYLSKLLPEYMIPSYFIQLEKMPLTSNGKLDRKILPDPNKDISIKVQYKAPRNNTEKRLVAIWNEVLGVDNIGITHNFFELGGHSLKATILASKIHKEFNIEFQLKEIFKLTTIQDISDYIEKAEKDSYSAVERVTEKEYYATSSAQKRMYMLQQFDLESIVYNMPGVMVVDGKFDRNLIEKAICMIIKKHEILRTSFETIDEQIVQKVHKEVEFKVEYMEKIGYEPIERVVNDCLKEFVRVFDITEVPLLRVKIIKIEDEKHILLFDMHHIISDGLSIKILYNEFIRNYEGKENKELKIQYKDYAEWQNTFLNSVEFKKQQEYWVSKFSNKLPVLDITTDYIRPKIQSFEGNSIRFELNEELTKKLVIMANETGSTMYMVLLSAVSILLSKYSGQEDIIVGSLISGRQHIDLDELIGVFINTLAIRSYPMGDKTYEQFLIEIKEDSLNAYENQNYPFEELLDVLHLNRDVSRNPLFDVMFSMQNDMGIRDISFKGLSFHSYNSKRKVSNFDLTFIANQLDDKVIINIEYCTKLFKKETIERMKEHYINILRIITQDLKITLSKINILTKEEKHKLMYEFNNNKVDFPKDTTIYQLFEEWAEKTPNNIALEYNEKKLTYEKLNQKSNQIARLIKKNVKFECNLMAVMMKRSLEMVESILGIWKAGGAYIPIDVNYPIERVIMILKDSGVKVLISMSNFITEELEKKFTGNIIKLDLCENVLRSIKCDNLKLKIRPHNLAYVIYTSGSTGKPKGVMVEQIGMMNHIQAKIKELCITQESIIAQNASHCFDISVWQFFSSIVSGGKTVIFSNDIARNPEEMIKKVIGDKVTVLEIVPSFMAIMLDYLNEQYIALNNLEYILVTGEVLKRHLVEKWFSIYSHIKIVNAYGPTEASDDITHYIMDRCPDLENIPIGNPIQNFNIYIVDKNMELCPMGTKGEIAVSGIGVGRGYLNDTKKTNIVFMEDPFAKEKGIRLYKTGDLGIWLSDGTIEFCGRKDYQVKIRGFRIELGEIESKLINLPEIKDVVVIDREDRKGNKHLYAYITTEKDFEINRIKEELSRSLPEYMIPSYFIRLDKLPLTANGKIDRKSLPEVTEGIQTCAEYESPRNKIEEQLVEIWSEVLGIDKVGINDDFFELGGHSLKATVLISKMHKKLNIEIPFRDIFQFSTIKVISEKILNSKKSTYKEIENVGIKDFYEASSAQKRMYMLQQFNVESTGYNMVEVITIKGIINKVRLEKTFYELIKRHESLRTHFEIKEDVIVQIISENIDFKVEYLENMEGAIDECINEFIKVFDLNKPPLFRVKLIKLEKEKHILMIDMHHIISDGISKVILIEDFIKIYSGLELKKLRIQYKDYSAWQNKMLKSKIIKSMEEYWIEKFSGQIPVLNMPTDYIRPTIQSFEGASIMFQLEEKTTKGLKKIVNKTGSTMYMVLLSAINILFSKYSGQEDIVIGSPIAGRPNVDLNEVVGMFVNTLAMRNHPEGNKSYENFLKEVKENALDAYENQEYPFEELVDKLNLYRDISRNPLFDTMFVMQNMDEIDITLTEIKFSQYKYKNLLAKFDLTFEASEVENDINFNIYYCTKLFKKETIEIMIKHFKKMLNEISKNIKIKLSEIDILSEKEKYTLLHTWNNTYAEYPKNTTVHELFQKQVEKTPNKIAVVFENTKLTYKELNAKSNKVARTLKQKGVKTNSIVGIVVERSVETIIGILGIIKSGAAYLPIEPEYPAYRVEYMLKDSKVKMLLVQDESIKFNTVKTEILDLLNEDLFQNNEGNIEPIIGSSNLVYVIYTSGTTGQPKGVGVSNNNLINYCYWLKNKINLNKNDKTIIVSSLAFDLSYTSLYSGILSGCEIHIVSKSSCLNPEFLLRYIEINDISFLKLTPSLFNIIVNSNSFYESSKCINLKTIILGGEKIRKLDVEMFNKKYPNVLVMNHYGPTEATIGCIANVIDFNDNNSVRFIGTPISNTQVYILDKKLNLLPIGATGEICIVGDCVTKGYINDSLLTATKFVPNLKIGIYKYEKLYRTGDCGRISNNGRIEFLGRIDNQIKIRGFRVEIDEIESRLLDNKRITDATVINKENKDGEDYLCAYIVCDSELKVEEIREYLSKYLPAYMIPSYFVWLEKIPLTSNGKINKKELPEPDENIALENIHEVSQNEIEEKLEKIWREVLHLRKIGINDNFFQIGGHSLKSVALIGKINKEFNIELPLNFLFNAPTIKAISEWIVFDRYKEHSENKVMTRLNAINELNIFAFPPALGYGLAFNEIAKYINSHTVYSFDFIEDANRIEQYIKQIISIQRNEPYILVGYSAGGNLAFEVAKELESRGYEVSNLILFDSTPRLEKKCNDDNAIKERKEMINNEIRKICTRIPSLKSYINEEDILRKVEKFALYCNQIINNGNIDTDIYLILNSYRKLSTVNKRIWNTLTQKEFKVYQGYGEHNKMLDEQNAKLNAKILNEILNGQE